MDEDRIEELAMEFLKSIEKPHLIDVVLTICVRLTTLLWIGAILRLRLMGIISLGRMVIRLR